MSEIDNILTQDLKISMEDLTGEQIRQLLKSKKSEQGYKDLIEALKQENEALRAKTKKQAERREKADQESTTRTKQTLSEKQVTPPPKVVVVDCNTVKVVGFGVVLILLNQAVCFAFKHLFK